MNALTAMSRAEPGSAGTAQAVSDLLVSAAEWAELAKPVPELRGFLRSHIQLPGLTRRPISLEPTDDPALAPFTESLDLTGDGSLVLLAHPPVTRPARCRC